MLASVDQLLRGEGRHSALSAKVAWSQTVAIAVTGGLFYGAVMGFYGGKPLQSLFSAVKVPLFLWVSSLLCLPSFFVVNTVLGLRSDFPAACRGVLAAQATLAVSLAALAPVTAFAYVSSRDYHFVQVLNGGIFAASALAGQVTLSRHYRALVLRDPRHRLGKAMWLLLYVFVAIQMAWVLRPFIGAPGLPTHFFREDAWSNSYVRVVSVVWAFIAGR